MRLYFFSSPSLFHFIHFAQNSCDFVEYFWFGFFLLTKQIYSFVFSQVIHSWQQNDFCILIPCFYFLQNSFPACCEQYSSCYNNYPLHFFLSLLINIFAFYDLANFFAQISIIVVWGNNCGQIFSIDAFSASLSSGRHCSITILICLVLGLYYTQSKLQVNATKNTLFID